MTSEFVTRWVEDRFAELLTDMRNHVHPLVISRKISDVVSRARAMDDALGLAQVAEADKQWLASKQATSVPQLRVVAPTGEHLGVRATPALMARRVIGDGGRKFTPLPGTSLVRLEAARRAGRNR